MIYSNAWLLDFVLNNYVGLLLFVLLTIKVVPPEWAGYWKYNNNSQAEGPAKRMSALGFLLEGLLDSILPRIWVHLSVIFDFSKTVTILIFCLVIFALFVTHQVSGTILTLVSIGIISLYLERLIETGKSIKLFGGAISWERKD